MLRRYEELLVAAVIALSLSIVLITGCGIEGDGVIERLGGVLTELTLGSDADEVRDEVDNCRDDFNPDQDDLDEDGVGNACDNCPSTPNGRNMGTCIEGLSATCRADSECDTADGKEDGVCANDQSDTDSDGVGDACDNCPEVKNDDQLDFDLDGIGNRCDNCPTDANDDQLDGDEDGVGDVCDNCPDVPNPTQADSDGNGIGDVCQ